MHFYCWARADLNRGTRKSRLCDFLYSVGFTFYLWFSVVT